METAITMKLNDGRSLGYAEYGDRSGTPVFYNHSGSRLDIRASSPIAADLGIRLIALDRPGIGLSDFRPNYQFLDWPDDVAEAADRLGLDNFAMFGHSIGTVFSLACAYKMPERLTRCALIGAAAPLDAPGVTEGMHRFNKALFSLNKRTSWPMRVQAAVMARLLNGKNAERTTRSMMNMLNDSDREAIANQPELMDDMLEAGRETFRSGTRGAVWANLLLAHPWGFPLEDIKVPVAIWQGEEDSNAPVAMAKYLAQTIPDCQLHIMTSEGHLSSLTNNLEEILNYLTATLPEHVLLAAG